ncbi:MAG TPA: Holliday junction branch migration protein RuvA [Pseudonocardiaceae bacterium]|nr:Holliday junction branch migration protein RuvA [Pseudonocardiaceae bacterium]
MIASVRGNVLEIGLDHAVVEVGGVGFEVRTTPGTLAGLRRGQEARLVTTLVVREDSLTLFGFADAQARELFGLLQTVSGIGPRLALATLAVLEPDALRAALAEGNITALTQVPGIGRKGAERLIVELRDKVGALPGTSGPTDGGSAPAGGSVRAAVVEALLGLGFAAKQAESAVDGVLAGNGHGPDDTAGVLRRALTTLGRKR